jgi:O-acetylhomoserine (thiol)-lyase
MTDRSYGFATQQLHAGQSPDPATGARAVPIYQTPSFVFKDFAAAKAISSVEEFGFDYSRITNPTNEVLENRIAALEGGSGALSLASGSAATATAILNITHAGDEIVAAKRFTAAPSTCSSTPCPDTASPPRWSIPRTRKTSPARSRRRPS